VRKTIATFASCLFLAACGEPGKPPAQQAGAPGAAPPPSEVEVITVSKGPVTLTQEVPGRLEAFRSAQVRARIEGIVEKRLFEEGSEVPTGKLLFQIDARTYRAAQDAAAAEAETARLALERARRLRESGMVSQQNLDTAEARLKQTEAQLARTRLDLENTRVPAPIAGRIGRALVTEGALVGRGEATHLATIEQIDPIKVNFTQAGADLLRLQAAMQAGRLKKTDDAEVELLLEDGRRYEHPGRILFAEQAVDPSTGAVSLRAQFPNPKRGLLPGMFVRLRFPTAVAEEAIRVPQRAVQGGPQGQYVTLALPEGQVRQQPVKTGGMSAGDFIVSEGLAGGEQVIVNGLQKIRPGAPVKAVPWQPQGAPVIPPPAAKKEG
jgi:membrane fusion protein (multidrug efflux system)